MEPSHELGEVRHLAVDGAGDAGVGPHAGIIGGGIGFAWRGGIAEIADTVG